ncbi:alkaline phosphatase family protein [Dictyobacter aurantiacus]|uniref:Phosphodiesterase n=1 Tax=Dictyobacter aurantiacus TaxID=1936993 RepID=A0A401ZIT3_9CHLR|nr:alkaline phosphatase family protein [Dictyobacter aurantiacus]GCE06766.1 phosphodiesterase [Dictyobacter aurantiacus]
MTTGGSPRTTGVFYDDSYDRTLSAPGSKCATKGAEIVYDESIDKDPTALNGGGGIDPTTLPLDPSKGCTPVYPHSFLRVNTIFEVARQAGLNTAWSDKHLAYDLLNGPSGKGVADLYSPEIASVGSTVADIEAYDDVKVQAILHEIDGKDHSGTKNAPVPAIFGMNFQAVSVAQKTAGAGYVDAAGTPSAQLQEALTHTDQSLGKFVSELNKRGLSKDTTIIVTAKHGQSPVDPNKHQIVDSKIIPNLVNSVQPGLLAQATQDDVSLIWLTDSSKTNAVVAKLSANAAQANIGQIISGDELKQFFNDPQTDSRTPDIVVLPNQGVIYAKPTATKIAEHGGFSDDDTHVALLVSNPDLKASAVYTPVSTTQIAPSILQILNLNPQALQAVRAEKTQLLPGLSSNKGDE